MLVEIYAYGVRTYRPRALPAVQGLDPLVITLEPSCVSPDIAIRWESLISGEAVLDSPSLTLDRMLVETTPLRITFDDLDSGTRILAETFVLTPNPSFDDLNGDGCNTMSDLTMLLPNRLEQIDDVDGGGTLDPRDVLCVPIAGDCVP